ncbi:hypothetical protein ABIB40_000231 [Pedobacter sp. UYP30]
MSRVSFFFSASSKSSLPTLVNLCGQTAADRVCSTINSLLQNIPAKFHRKFINFFLIAIGLFRFKVVIQKNEVKYVLSCWRILTQQNVLSIVFMLYLNDFVCKF